MLNIPIPKIKIRRYFCYIGVIALILFVYLTFYNLKLSENLIIKRVTTTTETLVDFKIHKATAEIEEYDKHKYRIRVIKEKIKRISKASNKSIISEKINNYTFVNYNVHCFYYAWYKSINFDGAWAHWNHKYLPNWNQNDFRKYPEGSHNPPEDIGANFYPLLGPYSSNDPEVLKSHMKYFKIAGVGVLVLSWAPPGFVDSPESNLKQLLDIAQDFGIKVSLQIEPYKDRNPENFLVFWKQFLDKYGAHKALYKIRASHTQSFLPVTYIYDSYLIESNAWKTIFGKKGFKTIRSTKYDGIFLGLLVDAQHKVHIKRSEFDGFYTYFASNGFSYGSSWKNWNSLSRFANQNNLLFIPSVGPGYIDVRVRPWNSINTKDRSHGRYYETAWRTAVNSGASFISITSFNEWHEGTQIEPAIYASGYSSYDPQDPLLYLNLTRRFMIRMPLKN